MPHCLIEKLYFSHTLTDWPRLTFALCVYSDIFSLGFGPFRWVCTSGNPADLAQTDNIATTVLEEISSTVNERVRQQYSDNIRWIREAGRHSMVESSYNPVQSCG